MTLTQFLGDTWRPALETVLVLAGLCFAWLAYLLSRGSRNEYERNRARVRSSFMNVFLGKVPTTHDGVRDDKVSAGLAWDKRRKKWVEQGRLSNEALDDVLLP